MRTSHRALPLLLAGAFVLGACSEPAPEGGKAAEASAKSEQEEPDRLRALPYLDFSPDEGNREERDGVVALDSARAWRGYSLYTVRPYCRADLVDLRGRIVRSWSSSPCERWAQAELLPDGSGVRHEPTSKIVLDLERLYDEASEDLGYVARYARAIQQQRGDYNGRVLSIRPALIICRKPAL